jgi:hypothetical protein
MMGIGRPRNTNMVRLDVSPPNKDSVESERSIITKLDDKATLQTSIKWSSANRDR